ncbi:30S ribosomal protein S1 [bacterium]|nr:30S ribosomal protein S1 [bacterium]
MDFTHSTPTGPGEHQASSEISKKGGESDTASAGEATRKDRRLNARLGLEVEELGVGKSAIRREVSFEEQMLQYEQTLKEIKEGEIVRGSILHIGENEVQINVGFKSEGYIPRAEFGSQPIKVGDEVDVFLESLEDQDGLVVLSKEKADFLKVWDTIKDAYDTGNIMEGTVDRRIKGGLVVRFLGVDAFLPGSQVALRQVPDLEALIGQSFAFKIIKLNKRRRNIVVSRRTVLEEERNRLKAQIIQELAKGQVRRGTVKNITDFGAFVDLGGIDGLLHLTDMSWGRISHPSELVAIGTEIEVKVLDIDLERERISLGLKQLTPYPWDNVEAKFPVESVVKGKVVSITDYGAFVELEKGVEGLIHISEMSWTRHVKHPSKIVSIGQEVEAKVLAVDRENEKISLGLKQTEPDPWDTLDDKYPIGSIVPGKVRNLTNFGAFVELEEGIDGLVHISDMSWTRRIRHPREMLAKGDDIEVVILAIDKDIRRISLGVKQLTPDPWLELSTKYVEGTFVEAKVVRPLERGVVVEVEDGVEGFIPVSHLGDRNIKQPELHFAEDDLIPAKVIKVDHEGRRIVLSVGDRLREEGGEAHKEYMDKYGKPRFTAREKKPEEEGMDMDEGDLAAGLDELPEGDA